MVPGVSSEGYTFRDLADHFSIYFCGHLHRLAAGTVECTDFLQAIYKS
jgi:hypothetical protein